MARDTGQGVAGAKNKSGVFAAPKGGQWQSPVWGRLGGCGPDGLGGGVVGISQSAPCDASGRVLRDRWVEGGLPLAGVERTPERR